MDSCLDIACVATPFSYGSVQCPELRTNIAHQDLLSANVIKTNTTTAKGQQGVAFIDYEYSAACPAAFDLANHFSEWTGYECDYNLIPTKSTRRGFLQEYLASYNKHTHDPVPDSMLEFLEKEVDRYRGMPGLYWGIWALIQATISNIDFNYAECKFFVHTHSCGYMLISLRTDAEFRLEEYTAWRREESGSRARESSDMPLRERRWAES
jgi:ethanolamine kinase